MPLPFLKDRKKTASVIVQTNHADGSHESDTSDGTFNPQGDQPDAALEACGADFISSVEAKDAKGVAAAMRAAFQILESEPHEEAGEPEQGEIE